MRIFRFTINLRLRHPQMDSAEVSTALGMSPKRQARAAPQLADSDHLGGAAGTTETYWSSEGRSGEDSELVQVIEEYITELEPHASFLASFCASGGCLELFVGWFASSRSGGEIIRHDLLKRFGDLHVDLSFDAYSGVGEPDDPS